MGPSRPWSMSGMPARETEEWEDRSNNEGNKNERRITEKNIIFHHINAIRK
jgi:hypothetical protein